MSDENLATNGANKNNNTSLANLDCDHLSVGSSILSRAFEGN
ncbi:hypothetical protein [uncultured Cohaesibacter sp.]|nr:hypothetical protein [uncultured Cohaesibacter sp.]